jgi:serum/glucocorticoid-regulated kinase 2
VEAKDLLTRLLDRDPKKRLGSLNGAEDIKNHPFFEMIDWDKMFTK